MTKDTSDIQTKHDRIASVYEFWDAIPERLFYSSWRRQLWDKLTAEKIPEIGVARRL